MPTSTSTKVVDGDTFEINPQRKCSGKTRTRGRRAGYDAPEYSSEKGNKARGDPHFTHFLRKRLNCVKLTNLIAGAWSSVYFLR
jgi:endonuclease YncB( thermonuclease family)